MSPTSSNTQTLDLLSSIDDLARAAGQAILEVYEKARPEVTHKADASPLTEADLASHEILVAGLARATPEIPVLSEEGADIAVAVRRRWQRFWLVDPLDGTKEFIKRNGEFTVNVALVEDGVPVLGVVYAPVLDRCYLGGRGLGAWRQDSGAQRRAIDASGSGEAELAVVASRSHASDRLRAFLAALGPHRLVSMGSSLKLCLVADGTADIYPRLGPTMEWDTGAAHAVVLAAGGRVVDTAGEALVYNKENLLNPHFLVLGQRSTPWRQALTAATSPPSAS